VGSIMPIMERLKNFLILSFLIIILINLTLVSAYIVLVKYGSVTLNPGEKYVINIPFFGESEHPEICGKAQTTSKEALRGINVSVYYDDNLVNKSTTDSNGEYCITLPQISSSRKYDIFIEYDNQTSAGIVQLASNDYDLNFNNNLVFDKSSDEFAILTGTIDNEDAEIENGRVEVNLQYWPENATERFEVFDYQRYFVNIDAEESYKVPSEEFNVSWEIPSDAKIGRYKFYVKASFNANEKSSNVYFDLIA